MSRLFLLILLAASCHSEEDKCQDIDSPPNPTSGCCGIHLANDDLKISGDAAINQFPWVALIENTKARIVCTGSLISSRHVLTAAHCTTTELKKVLLGEYNITNPGPDCVKVGDKQICNDGVLTIDIATVNAHPEYNHRNYQGHDIAVIKLADKVPHNEFIRPICLPTSDVLVSPPDNLRFINAGWGFRPDLSIAKNSDLKHYVSLPYVDLKICQEIYETNESSNFKVSDSHICARGEKDLDTCRRDGGGPLMLKENGHYTLVGTVSFGLSECGLEGKPSVYTKVYSYLPYIWLSTVVNEL